MNFGLRVKQLRKKLGLTQQELANQAGVGQSTIGQIESGRNKSIKADKLLQLAESLNTTTEYLVNGVINHDVESNEMPSDSLKKLLMPDESFLPTIPEGSELIIDTTQTTIIDGKIYQIKMGECFFIRRLFYQIPNNLKLVCDNQIFEESVITPENVTIIGRVARWSIDD